MSSIGDFNPGYYPFGQKKPDWDKEDGQWNTVGTGKDDDMTWLKSSEDRAIPKEIMHLKVDELILKGAELIQEFEGRTGFFRRFAEIIMALRCKHTKNMTDSNGKAVRDLNGQTAAYKADVRKMYQAAGVPYAAHRNHGAAIRYHVRKLKWDVATTQERFLLSIPNPYEPATSASPAVEPTNGVVDQEAAEGAENGQETPQGEAAVRSVDILANIALALAAINGINEIPSEEWDVEPAEMEDRVDELLKAIMALTTTTQAFVARKMEETHDGDTEPEGEGEVEQPAAASS